ncbi:hypothetical protein H6G65_15980 [Microcystis elabens FACHB-917]|nr:hypothetical protein [Microcystis elabens FACHB-917]
MPKDALRKVHLVSYATGRFKVVRNNLNDSAREYGIDNIVSYDDSDLHSTDYYLQNKEILDEDCGAGYWAWKPYFILSTFRRLRDGDILLYCDAGSLLIGSPEPLLKLAARHPSGIILFDARPLKCRQFTKRDCFVRMNCDRPVFWNANKIIATVLLVRKCPRAVVFLEEWLFYCQDRAIISHDPNLGGLPDLPGFIQHRNDQSILNVLAVKYRLETFRNPTVWGNFLKLPSFRVPGEPVLSPYNLLPEIQSYSPRPQRNSPYGTIFEINRSPNLQAKPPMPVDVLSRASQGIDDVGLVAHVCRFIAVSSRKLSPRRFFARMKRIVGSIKRWLVH